MDTLAAFKETQKIVWSGFAPLATFTATTAPHLVRMAGIAQGKAVLDVACGTGVVALTAARLGAHVTGVDLTPELVEHARQNGTLMGLPVTWHQGDAEALPVPDNAFDVVVSQFGHMFAPRPERAIAEMLRVLKPGGTLAFSTWPPELFVGRFFALMAGYAPPPPEGVSSPLLWGDPNIIRQRLGDAVRDVCFFHGVMTLPMLSVQHYRVFVESSFGPTKKVLAALDESEPARAATLRRALEELASHYLEDNALQQGYLLTRAIKR